MTVLGAGIFGLSVAWACCKRGAKLRVIDPAGVASGASGGIVGALAPHTPEQWNDKKQFQLDSLLMAEAFWHDVAEVSGREPGYARLGRLQPILDDAGLALADRRAGTAAQLWGQSAEWRIEDAVGDWHPRSPSGKLIFDTLSARIHPRAACTALAAALQARGAEIVADGPREGAVVHATGYAGLDAMTAAHTRQVGNGVKGQAILLEHDARALPQLYADGLHIVPHWDGSVAIGSTSERYFEVPASTDAQLDEILARAVAQVPLLGNARILARWAGVRPRARTRAPMLGDHPFSAGAFVANGGFKIGFGMAPKVGEVMADLVLEGVDTIPDPFRAERSL